MKTRHMMALLDNYRPAILAAAMLLFFAGSYAQDRPYQTYPAFGMDINRGKFEFTLTIPAVDSLGLYGGDPGSGAIVYYRPDSSIYAWTGSAWVKQRGGSGSGSGVTDGDKGDIVISSSGTLYEINSLAVTNAKINDVAWVKVTGTPTTLAGYGITDGSGPNVNTGTFFRWLKPGTQEFKTAAAGYGQIIDSTSNTNALTFISDTATLFPAVRATIPPSSGSGGGKFTIRSSTIDIDSSGGVYEPKADTGVLSTKSFTKYEAYKPIAVAEYSTIRDAGDYAAFAWPAVIRDTAYFYIKVGFTHAVKGYGVIVKSTNGLISYDSVGVIAGVNGSGVSNMIATAIDDTIWVAWQTASQAHVKIAYSVDYGVTHTIIDSLSNGSGYTIPFGKFMKLPSGKLLFNSYSASGSAYSVNLWEATDRTNFTQRAVLVSGSLPGTPQYNETWIEVIDGDTDANTRMIAFIRDEDNGEGPLQMTSADGGATWTNRGRVTSFIDSDEVYGNPTSLLRIGNKLVAAKGWRVDLNGTATDDYHLATIEGSIDSVFTDPTKWSVPTKMYNSRANYVGIAIDFGYANLFMLGGQPRIVLYDVSAKEPLGNPNVQKTRVFTMPVYPNPYTLVRSQVLQSIPAATETIVNTPLKLLDSDNMFNSDTGAVIIKRDGMYTIKAYAHWVASNTGTYRKAFLRATNTTVNNAESNRLLDERVIQPSNNVDFLGMNLSATVFLRQGEKITLSVMHDHSAARDIGSNSFTSTLQSYIEIKQIK